MDDGGRRIDNSGWGSGRAPAPATGIPACAAAVRAGPLSCAFARRGGEFSGLPSPSLSHSREPTATGVRARGWVLLLEGVFF
jgi:hypothetical protein